MSNNQFTIDKIIMIRRAEKGMSQKELGTLAGLEPNSISRIESGELDVSLRKVEAIAGVFGLTLGQFFSTQVINEKPYTNPND